MRATRPPTGARFTWQLNTFMKMETRTKPVAGRPSSGGGAAGPTWLTRPSAGAMTRSEPTGVVRGGSRKKATHQMVSPKPIQPSGANRSPSTSVTTAKMMMNG